MASDEKETRTDALIRRAKDHPMLSVIIFCALVLGGIAVFINQMDSLRKVFWSSKGAAPANESKLDPNEKDRIFAQCQFGLMPSVVPPEGRIHVLVTSEIPKEMGGGGLTDYSSAAAPGSPWTGWTNNNQSPSAYRCELTSFLTEVAFNLSIPIHLTFRASRSVPWQENTWRTDDGTTDRDWEFTIPKLEPSPAAPYVFYVWNCCVQKFVEFQLPDHAITTQGKRIPVVKSADNLYTFLSPVSFK